MNRSYVREFTFQYLFQACFRVFLISIIGVTWKQCNILIEQKQVLQHGSMPYKLTPKVEVQDFLHGFLEQV